MKRRAKIRAMKARNSFINRPIVCKIEITDNSGKVMKYEGGIKKGFRSFKEVFFNLYQFEEEDKSGRENKQEKQV